MNGTVILTVKRKNPASEEAIEWSKKKNPPLMDPPEADLLMGYAKKCKIHFVEIGTHKGGSASLISRYLPPGVRLTTIDTFEEASEGSFPPQKKPPTYEEAKRTIQKQGETSKVKIIKGYSWEVAEAWTGEIDMLFIDGDHRYKAVKEDFKSWEPYLIKDGYILMHDVNRYEGVTRTYEEILRSPRFILEERVITLAAIKKLG